MFPGNESIDRRRSSATENRGEETGNREAGGERERERDRRPETTETALTTLKKERERERS